MGKSAYEKAKDILLKEYSDKKYKKVNRIDLYFKDNNYFNQLYKEGHIHQSVKNFLDKHRTKFSVIYHSTDIPFFRTLKYEEVLRAIYGSNEKTIFEINEEEQEIANKLKSEEAVFQDLLEKTQRGEITWSKGGSKNTIKYHIIQKEPKNTCLMVDLNATNEKKYNLVIQKKSFPNIQDCLVLESAIQENIKNRPTPKNHTVYQIHHTKEELKQEVLDKKEKRQKSRQKIREYQEKRQEQLKQEAKENRQKAKEEKKAKLIEKQRIQAEKEKRQRELAQLPQIGYKDFVVKKAVFFCTSNEHKIEDIDAAVNVIDHHGEIQLVKISAGYCEKCHIYFIMESTFDRLKIRGTPICRVIDDKTYKKGAYLNGALLAQESILMQYGYNVSQAEGLSDTRRQKILAVLVDNGILSRTEIIGYLDFFINQRQYQSKYEIALSKWERDREFIEEYRRGDYETFGVYGIYNI